LNFHFLKNNFEFSKTFLISKFGPLALLIFLPILFPPPLGPVCFCLAPGAWGHIDFAVPDFAKNALCAIAENPDCQVKGLPVCAPDIN
jgi:hypothetical protein